MSIRFSKYHGTQNDFILYDNLRGNLSADELNDLIALCHRHTGVGADGVLLLESEDNGFDYQMRFYNPDGQETTFCGNGARCLFQFASDLGIVNEDAVFLAGDGPHKAGKSQYGVKVQMKPVREIKIDSNKIQNISGSFGLYDTGVEHLVIEVENVSETDLDELGWRFRPNGVILKDGLNTNIFHLKNGKIEVRTFERGVDAETMSCGTGNVAVAYHLFKQNQISDKKVSLFPVGGRLVVEFPEGFQKSPWLHGNAIKICSGIVR